MADEKKEFNPKEAQVLDSIALPPKITLFQRLSGTEYEEWLKQGFENLQRM